MPSASEKLMAALDVAASTTKPAEKLAALKSVWDEDVAALVKAALDPFVTYGVADVADYRATHEPPETAQPWGTRAWGTLGDLASRRSTGALAAAQIKELLSTLSASDAELFLRVITKDLRAGIGASTVRKIAPTLLPNFSPMLAQKFSARRARFPAHINTKLDGIRVLARVTQADCSLYTRNGHVLDTTQYVASALHAQVVDKLDWGHATAYVFDGEMTAGSFLESVAALRKKGVTAVDARYHIFDMIPEYVFYGTSTSDPLHIRYANLVSLLEYAMPDVGDATQCFGYVAAQVAYSEAEAHNAYETRRSEGLEGIVLKDLEGLYESRRSTAWLKLKAEESEDLLVIGTYSGEGKYAGMLGGLVVDFKGHEVRVGSGLTDDMRSQAPEAFLGRIAEILFHEETPDGSLRHPRFKAFRDHMEKGVKD